MELETIKGLKVVHINIRSIRYKLTDLKAWVTLYKPNIITISETWLYESFSDDSMNIDNYVLYRADRDPNGGGLATYVDSNLHSERLTPAVEPVHFESLFINIKFHDNKHLTIGNIYRPPSAPAHSTECILSTINSFDSHNELIILGDFNKNWPSHSCTNDRNLFRSVNLTQLIKEPTRVDNRSSSLLDWILVTNPGRIIKSGVLSDCFSDHNIIFCVWKIKIPKSPPKYISIRQSKNINVDSFIQDLIRINWSRFQLIPSVEDAWDFFHSEVTNVIDVHAPIKTIRVKGRHLPWISSHLIKLFKERDKAWAKHRSTRDPGDWEHYRHLRNLSKTETRNAKSNYYKNSFSLDFHNPKQFWNKLNTFLNKTDKKTINQIQINNNTISDPLLISQAFNTHFSSIGVSQFPNSYITADSPRLNAHAGSFSFKKILPTDVFQAICELKDSCGPGPDGLEAKYIKLAAHILAYPLADLFNLSLSTSSLPSIWKCASVTPIYKTGDPTDINNYRPISIICTTAKIFEKLVFKQLSKYINHENILSPHQSGFRPHHSTTTATLKLTSDVFLSFNKSHLTGAIFIDLSKAFDMVDHYLLLDKLYSVGVQRSALLWFNSYLHNRRQRVGVQGFQSDFLLVENGVPQGSILGPLLFSLFINDLPDICSHSQVQLYADNTVIYVSHKNVQQIQQNLQSDFNLVQKWLKNNKLLLNMRKSCSMLFGHSRNEQSSSNLLIHFEDGSHLEKVDSFKYLGITLDPELSFKHHIDNTVKKTYGSLCSLYPSTNCFSFEVRKRIINQVLLPIVDYADIVYQTATDTHLKPLNVLYNSLCRVLLRFPYRTHHCG